MVDEWAAASAATGAGVGSGAHLDEDSAFLERGASSACSMEATLGPTYSVSVLVTTCGLDTVDAAAANMALN